MDLQLFEKLRRIDEVVATIDLQKEVKDYYKGEPTKLVPSTFGAPGGPERSWYKFWLLTDGTVIPVDYTHRDAVRDATTAHFETDPRTHFLDTGAVAGYINTGHTGGNELGIQSAKKLTKQQISQLRNLGIEYKVISIVAAIGRKDWESDVKSSKHLDYLLNYGPDVDEAKSEDEKEQFFVERTEKHIALVQGAAAKILKAYPEYDTDILRDQIEVHDQSKLEEPERTPYVEITWRHKLENEKGEYDPYNGKGYQKPGKLSKEDENVATIHHITTNSHHPEYHLEDKTKANINKDDRDKSDEVVDAFLMPPSDIVEMVADWQAMSEELQTNTAREWFDKQKNVRWKFSEEQEELIDKLLAVFEETEESAVEESKHSHDKCMDCSSIPEVEVLWAEGMGHCWFCMEHFKDWATKGDGKGDVCAVKKIQKGKATKDWKSNTSPNIMDTMKFLKESRKVLLLDKLLKVFEEE